MQYSLLVISREATEAEIGKEAMDWGRAAFDAYAKSLDAAGDRKSTRLNSSHSS